MTLDEATIRTVTEIATKTTLEAIKKQKHKQLLDDKAKLLKRTKAALTHYDIFKAHSADMKTDIDMYLKDIFPNDDLEIRSITGYKARSEKMVEYIDIKLAAYKDYAKRQLLDDSAYRRYCVMARTYITHRKWSEAELARYFSVANRTIERDLKAAIQEFSFFLFGVASLEDILR